MEEYDTLVIARICHEVNKAYCESIGDMSQVPWDDTPNNIKDSAINGVTYAIENPNVTSEEQHVNWCKFKMEDGWVYGEVKDVEKKTHPCLVPYEELPKEQQTKDDLFRAVVFGYIGR